MKKVKTILLTGVLTFGVFSIISYTSCSKKDKCDSVQCQNGGTCVDGSCKCPVGFEGPNCETKSGDKFLGTYNATDACPAPDPTRSNADLNYSVTISAGSDPTTVYIINLANASSDPAQRLVGSVISTDSVVIDPQTLSNGRIYSGTIVYDAVGSLTGTFQARQNGSIVEACNTSMTKQ